ncbi:MAG: ScpA family protein [Candidatus Falkowbacteria bacterium]
MIEFRTEKFNGPLGLLLQLIEKEELDITQIGLAQIADEYVKYIQSHKIDPEQIADFLVIAAKLLYIKSKALLPYLSTPEEDEEISELEHQLKMYKEFVEASKAIEIMLAKKKFSFMRDYGKTGKRRHNFSWGKFSPPKNLTPAILREQFDFIVSRFQMEEVEIKEEVIDHKISIDERIIYIQKALLERVRVNFTKILSTAKNKTEVIVNFLAVLELAKQRELFFEQASLFSDIIINKLEQ